VLGHRGAGVLMGSDFPPPNDILVVFYCGDLLRYIISNFVSAIITLSGACARLFTDFDFPKIPGACKGRISGDADSFTRAVY